MTLPTWLDQNLDRLRFDTVCGSCGRHIVGRGPKNHHPYCPFQDCKLFHQPQRHAAVYIRPEPAQRAPNEF